MPDNVFWDDLIFLVNRGHFPVESDFQTDQKWTSCVEVIKNGKKLPGQVLQWEKKSNEAYRDYKMVIYDDTSTIGRNLNIQDPIGHAKELGIWDFILRTMGSF